jgi:hypothetical protein
MAAECAKGGVDGKGNFHVGNSLKKGAEMAQRKYFAKVLRHFNLAQVALSELFICKCTVLESNQQPSD